LEHGSNSGMLTPIQDIWLQFVADRTNGCAYGTVLRLSVVVCNIMGVPRRQPHRRSGLATLPSVGAIP